jgi:hypothetical protein
MRYLPLLVVPCLACAGAVERGKVVNVEEHVVSSQQVERRADDLQVEAKETDDAVELQANWYCQLIAKDEVSRTTHYDRELRNRGTVIGIAVAGGIATLLGVVMVAAPEPFRAEDGAFSDRSAVRGVGAAFMVAGVGMAAGAGGVGLYSLGREHESRTNAEERVIEKRRSCTVRPRPARDLEVVVVSGPTVVPIGRTDVEGRARVLPYSALTAALDPTRPPMETPTVRVGGRMAHPLRLDIAVSRLDEAAWLAADPRTCLERGTCDGVESYLRAYPEGVHAAQGRQVLDLVTELEAARAKQAAKARLEELERQRLAREREMGALEERRLAAEAERARIRQEMLERERQQREKPSKPGASSAAGETPAQREAREREQQQREKERQEREAKRKAEEQAKAKCRADCANGCGDHAECTQACVRQKCG